MMDKSDNAQAVEVCKGTVGEIMGSLWGLTKQELWFWSLCQGALRYGWMFAYQNAKAVHWGSE